MEEIIRAIILGVIQGLTEFLPVSSSGHLELAKFFMGDESMPEESMLMTVMLHGATALSTMVVFWKDIAEILKGLFGMPTQNSLAAAGDNPALDQDIIANQNVGFWNDERMFSAKIILSMIPAVFVGLAFEKQIESFFGGQILLVGVMLILTGLLLFLADRAKNTNKKVGIWDAVIIGVSQAIAILPGISRSGATISTSVLLGIDRTRAARFSFLMVVPLILGKIAKDLLGGDIAFHADNLIPLIAGFVAAFLTGLVACTWMIALVKKSKLSYFAYYCFVVAAISITKALGVW